MAEALNELVAKAADRAAIRIDIITRVGLGEIEPAAAQAIADQLDIGPLAPQPSPENFDPMKLEHWSLLMAVCWIAYGSVDAVRHCWNAYAVRRYRWVRVIGPGGKPAHELRPGDPRWLHAIPASSIWEDEFNGTPIAGASPTRAQIDLWVALSAGRVTAFGRDVRKGEHESLAPIPKEDWTALKVGEAVPKPPTPILPGWVGADVLYFKNGEPVYVDVVVSRSELLTAFRTGQVQPASRGADEPRQYGETEPERDAIPAPVPQITEAEKDERNLASRLVIEAYIQQEHGNDRPKISDKRLADAINNWLAEKGQNRQAKYGVKTVSKTTVMRQRLGR